MELAKITSKGQITLPISIRKALNLNEKDQVAFIEKDGLYYLINPLSITIDNVRKDFKGEAKKVNLKNQDDVVNLVKEIRKKQDVKNS